ncbi:hypothetical protein F5882DRAFT_408839 [Hyaloscypha sp. PMI_1271]|nr:hypothetical protein F5882DRAFT_408839 [Hyaloscypha sp. PMI_1271]
MGEIGKHFRDVKEHRKQQEQTTPPSQRCHDWIIVMGSHYAKDRSWFKEYYPINANVGVGRAIGIGTVELEVKHSPQDQSTHTLVLEDVLHVPEAINNAFSPMLTGCIQSWVPGGTQGTDAAEQPLWYGTEFCGLSRLALAEVPQGESELERLSRDGTHFMLSLYLTEEQQRNINEQLRGSN